MGFRHSSKEFVKAVPYPVWCIWFTIIVLGLFGTVVAAVQAAPVPHPYDHACYSAKDWAPASDSVRPCVKLSANDPEGGAVRFTVADADGVVRYTGYVNTTFRQIIHVRIVRLYEDGSFTWKARNRNGVTVSASVGNLQD